MRRKIRTATVAIGASMVALLTQACSSGSSASPHSPVTVDLFAPFTGASAYVGNQFEYPGVSLAADVVNANGGIFGHPLDIVKTDSGADPADAPPALQQMLFKNPHVSAVIGITSSVAPSIVPVLNSRHIVMMSAAGNAEFDRNTNSYFYRTSSPDSYSGTGLAAIVLAKHYTRVALVFDNSDASQSDETSFISAYKKNGGTIAANEVISPDQLSYRSQVETIAAAHPQALVTEEDPQSAATLFSNIKELGLLGIPVIGGPGADVSQFFSAVANAVGGYGEMSKWFSVANWFKTSTNGKAYLTAEFRKVYGNGKIAPGVLINYDGMTILALAMVAAHSTNPAVYVKKIADVTGTTGIEVNSYPDGVKYLNEGKKIYYAGASGVFNYNQYLWLTEGYTLQSIDSQGNLNTALTLSDAQVSAAYG